ncbi:hypothetical protein GEMRC1_001476 [Eukaryota sp. GEM-RC1]
MFSTRVVLPSLSSMKVEDVLLFLQQWKLYSSVTPKKDLVPPRLLVDPFLLESLILTKPGVDASEEVFLDHLRSTTSFSTYEEFHSAISEIRVDVREGDVRERMSGYLRRFLQAKSRASGLKLPDSAFMTRFAKGILPMGLQKSLIARIRDEVFPDFSTLVDTATDELLDCSRVASWNKSTRIPAENCDPSRQVGTKSRSSDRSRNLANGTCFKCHQNGYLARVCPSKVKHEIHFLSHANDSYPGPKRLLNPLSEFK